jgi:hypothetical protein
MTSSRHCLLNRKHLFRHKSTIWATAPRLSSGHYKFEWNAQNWVKELDYILNSRLSLCRCRTSRPTSDSGFLRTQTRVKRIKRFPEFLGSCTLILVLKSVWDGTKLRLATKAMRIRPSCAIWIRFWNRRIDFLGGCGLTTHLHVEWSHGLVRHVCVVDNLDMRSVPPLANVSAK